MSGCNTHGGLLWYRHFPGAFLDRIKALSAEERGCYITVSDLIYQFGGQIADRAQWIAGQCNVSVKRWNVIRRKLLAIGKLLESDGLLTDPVATADFADVNSLSKAQAEAGRRGGQQKAANRRNAPKTEDVPNDNNDLAVAGLRKPNLKIVSNDLADYRPDNRPEDSSGSEENQSVSSSRSTRSTRSTYPRSTSVPSEPPGFLAQEQTDSRTEREVEPASSESSKVPRGAPPPHPAGDRRHPANCPALPVADYRVTFDASGRPAANGSLLDVVVDQLIDAADAPYGFYPVVNCKPLIDLLCDGYDPDDDIYPVVERLASQGKRAMRMEYYAKVIRAEKRPSWKPLGTWGAAARAAAGAD